MLGYDEALEVLRNHGASRSVIRHCKKVSEHAKHLAEQKKKADEEFVETAALLHDVGRTVTHGIRHGVEGAKIMRSMNEGKIARVCETHLGAGLKKKEAERLGLPEKDFIPQTIEEKIIAHADNEVKEDEVIGLQKMLEESDLPEKVKKRMKELKEEVT